MSFVPPPPKRRRTIRIRANRTGELPRVPPVPGSDDHVVAGNVADSPVRRTPVAEVSPVRARVEQNRDLHSNPPEDAPGPSQEHLAKEDLGPTQKLAYYANFAMHFGLSQSMMKHVDDLCSIFSGETSDLARFCKRTRRILRPVTRCAHYPLGDFRSMSTAKCTTVSSAISQFQAL